MAVRPPWLPVGREAATVTGRVTPAACLLVLLALVIAGVLVAARAEVRARGRARHVPGGPDDFAEWAAQLVGQRSEQDSAAWQAEWVASNERRVQQRHELDQKERP
jgi:hypothetical protein